MQILHFLQQEIVQKSPQVVKHVVKCEQWACSTLKAGTNKPIMIIAKMRDFARICEKIKEKRGFVMNPRFGRSVHNRPNFNGDVPSGRNIFPNSRKSLYL